MALGDLIRAAESGGDNYAKNPNSSASGPDQFLDRTWLDTIRTAIPGMADKPDSELLALKTNPEISGQVRDAYAAQNGAILSKAGLPVTPGSTYLAHFAGPQGAVSVLSADPSAPVSSLLGAAAVKANPFLNGMTAGDLQAWANRKMGGASAPQQVAQNAPVSPAATPAAPLQPNTAPPIFPQAQSPQGQGGGSFFGQMPVEQTAAPPPIFAPPRKPIDLSRLKAALQASGNRGFFNGQG